MKNKNTLSDSDLNRIIEMAWEDRTTFDAIKSQYGLNEQSVKELMRANLKSSSYKIWRKRVQGRSTKHSSMSSGDKLRFKSNSQRQITLNKISKRKRN